MTYDAWGLAREDVLARWTRATDPASLTPSVPRILREAADLVRRHPPADTTQDLIDDVIDRLESPHPQRVQRDIRSALRGDADPSEQVAAVVARVHALGLQVAPAPQPLPVINPEDIQLVCWLAITPGTDPTSTSQLRVCPRRGRSSP